MPRKTKPAETAKTEIAAIKGFDHEFKCRGFQFEVGKTYKAEGKISACDNGFHACPDNPFDVWNFYPVVGSDGKLTRYAEVIASGKIDTQKDATASKIASAEIIIKAELSLPEFIKRAVDWVIGATKGKNESGDSAQIGSSGHSAQIGSSGDSAQIGSSGHYAQIGSSGHSAQIGSSGDSAQIGSSGRYAKIGSSGDYAQIGSSGYYAKIGSSGYYAQIGSSGYSAKIVCEGKNAVVASAGAATIASGPNGTWISLAEFNSVGKCIGFATGCIGHDGLKASVPYRAKGGKLVEAA